MTTKNNQRKARPVATFLGHVQHDSGQVMAVLLQNEADGEVKEAECDSEDLRSYGIGSGDDFQCELRRSREGITMKFKRLPEKALSEEELDEIVREVDAVLPPE